MSEDRGSTLPVSSSSLRSPDGVVELEVYDFGGDGPLVLLVHATGFCARCYEPLIAELDGFAVRAVDLRGHGNAVTPPGLDYRWEDFGDDVAAVVASLHVSGRPLLGFGHSMGATALLMAERADPEAFSALFLYEPVVYPADLPPDDERLATLVGRARKRKARFESRAAALEHFGERPPYKGFSRPALEAFVEHALETVNDGSELRCHPDTEAEIYRTGPLHRVWDHLPETRVPIVLARGCNEQPGPNSWAKAIAERLPSARFLEFDGLGHLGPMEDPVRVGKAVSESFSEWR